ncbi:hypothetical protein [Williamsia deligens]|uniref:Htaa protein n=1 Tax=Williamsia deligens TaxID=321325 RepID=A0ABW3G6P5_9NOCA|nr:hypothetical protein [Williamsia deligens]
MSAVAVAVVGAAPAVATPPAATPVTTLFQIYASRGGDQSGARCAWDESSGTCRLDGGPANSVGFDSTPIDVQWSTTSTSTDGSNRILTVRPSSPTSRIFIQGRLTIRTEQDHDFGELFVDKMFDPRFGVLTQTGQRLSLQVQTFSDPYLFRFFVGGPLSVYSPDTPNSGAPVFGSS